MIFKIINLLYIFLVSVSAPGMAPLAYHRPNNAAIPASPQTHEMAIPNDLIGCIIGRGGQKINEIRFVDLCVVSYNN